MKLLACQRCQDVFKLRQARRACACDSSSGRYLADNHHVEVSGPCYVIGIANQDLWGGDIDRRMPRDQQNQALRAWVIWEPAGRVRRIE